MTVDTEARMIRLIGRRSGPLLTACVAMTLTYAACKKSDSSGSSDDDSGESDGETDGENDGSTPGTLAISENALATAYPEGLNVTAFPTEKVDPATVGTVAIEASLALQGDEPPPGDGGNPPP